MVSSSAGGLVGVVQVGDAGWSPQAGTTILVVAQLLDASGKKIEERSLMAKKDDETLAFRFQWKPEKPGLSFYRVRVAPQSEATVQGTTNQTRPVSFVGWVRVLRLRV